MLVPTSEVEQVSVPPSEVALGIFLLAVSSMFLDGYNLAYCSSLIVFIMHNWV